MPCCRSGKKAPASLNHAATLLSVLASGTAKAAYNIEIKAQYLYASFAKAHETALALGAHYQGVDHQIDTYFKTRKGRFKLRESSLSGAYLIPYIRPDQAAAKKSSYVLIPMNADSVAKTKELFATMLGIETIVEKNRAIYLHKNVRIHLDEVEGLGRFFELEAVYENDTPEDRAREQQKIDTLLAAFEIKESDLLSGSYREMTPKKL